ncbi:hypothetical protein Tco_0895816 [Tanacetum coccineum]|uniref:Uncharacterized protein n=1 Tax=Tanacetum coccineum TaxID=301880 RepID=A0ABQ5CGV6_9ASTR
MLDYGYNFMNTKIFIDNESTICIVKNPVFHSKTKHIEIKHHFIRDSNEKKLIQMIKIHTDYNVADLLTKAFDVGRFQYLIATTNDAIQISVVGLTYYCHLRYALIESPTIYVSLIQQFWNTAAARTLDNGKIEISATIDGKDKIVTEASIRRHLKLEDYDGISNLPTTEIFEQLALIGFIQIFLNKHKRLLLPHTRTYIAPAHTQKLFSNMRRAFKGYTRVDIPLFPTMLVQGPIFQGERSTVLVESHHTPIGAPSTAQTQISLPSRRPIRQETKVPQPNSLPDTNVTDEAASTGVDVRHGGAATTVTSLDAGHGSDNIDKTPSMPHYSPLPRVNTLGSIEDNMTLQELMVLCTQLSKKVESLEPDLKQTKKVYDAAYTKLIKKVKRLEKAAKSSQDRRRARIFVSDDKEDLEDPSKQGRKIAQIDEDEGITLVHMVSTTSATVTTNSVTISTASPPRVSTANDISTAETLVYIRRSASKYKAAVRLQADIKEEERQRITRVHEEASSFNVKEWEDIQAIVEADEELAQRI